MAGLSDKVYQVSPIWLQQVWTAAYGWYWYRLRYGEDFHAFSKKLRELERAPREMQVLYQEARLAEIIASAWKSKYYRDVFVNAGVTAEDSPFEVLKKIPTLTKKVVHTKAEDLLTVFPLPGDARIFRSSGTTGTPTTIYHPQKVLQKGQAWIEARSRNWIGLDYKDRRVMFGSRKICRYEQDRPPFWRYSPKENMAYASIYHLSPQNMPAYMAFLRKYQPSLIMGYPSSLYVLARYAIESNDYPAPAKAVITTSEEITPEMRVAFERVWQTRVYGTYGSVEHCVFASECENGNYHLSPEVGILEVLDAHGRACAPGEPGLAVCTGLHNDLQPLIRYEIGDVITLSVNQDCACGRTLPVIERIDGRVENMCYLPDGRMTLRFDTVFKGVENIWEAQVIQEQLNYFRILVVPGDGFSDQDVKKMHENMRSHAGDVATEVVSVDEIPRTANGKFKAVICNLSAEEIARVRG